MSKRRERRLKEGSGALNKRNVTHKQGGHLQVHDSSSASATASNNMEKTIVWDTGDWRNCFHMNPITHPNRHVEKKMCYLAKKQRRYDIQWGVVNSGNALCVAIFRTKKEADEYRKNRASAYSVVRVVITPLYTQTATIHNK